MARRSIPAFYFVVCCALFGCTDKSQENTEQEVKETQSQIQSVDIEDDFFSSLEKLMQDPSQREHYLQIIDKLTKIVQIEFQKNPEEMSKYIEAMVRLILKAGPGVAILAEEYASEVLREEMKRLRQDSNIANILEKEKQVNELVRENNTLKKRVGEYERLKAESQEKLLRVILWSYYTHYEIKFEFKDKTTGRIWSFPMVSIDAQERKIIALPAANYTVVFYEHGRVYKKIEDFVVSTNPSVLYETNWYHGEVSIFNKE